MCSDYGYPHPDDVTPEIQALVDDDNAVDALLKRLKEVKTMPELDAMRPECVWTGSASGSVEALRKIQKVFIKAKNRLERIPLRDRTW